MQPRMMTLTALLLTWTTVAAAAAADAGISGRFLIGDVALAPTHATALRARDNEQPRQEHTVIFLTTSAMDTDALAGQRDGYTQAINDPSLQGKNYLTLSLSADGQGTVNARVDGVQYMESTRPIMGQPGALKVECSENTAARVACRVWSTQPVAAMDSEPWTLDVRFSAPVIARLRGKPLPADGGEPAKAMHAFHRALKGNDLDAVFQLMSEDRVAQHNASYNTPEENLASLKDIWSARLAEKLTVTGGELLGDDHAFIEAEGELYPGVNMLFEIEMTRRDGGWVVHDGGSIAMLN